MVNIVWILYERCGIVLSANESRVQHALQSIIFRSTLSRRLKYESISALLDFADTKNSYFVRSQSFRLRIYLLSKVRSLQ